MADGSKIEWTDASWNPVTGCTEVSPGCDRCYAKTFAERWRGTPGHHFEQGFDVTLRPERLTQPLRWTKPRRVFVNSMSDLFHQDVPDGFIARVWDVMARCPQHTFQILTKRHGRMRSWVRRWSDTVSDDRAGGGTSGLPPMPRGPEAVRATYTSGRAQLFAAMLDSMGEPPEGAAYPLYDWMEGPRWWPSVLPNVWLGVSVESQQWAETRVPALLDTPAAVRWLSCEPLLGAVDLADFLRPPKCSQCGGAWGEWACGPTHALLARDPGLHWVVVGGESGHGARPMHPRWPRSLRDQCARSGVPFFFKQWGEYQHGSIDPARVSARDYVVHSDGTGEPWATYTGGYPYLHPEVMARVGKTRAGRDLDGRTHDDFPEVARG